MNQRFLDQAPVVHGTKLIEEEVRIPGELARCSDSNAERLGIVDQVRGEWNDERRRMLGIEEGLGLDDENRSCLSRFRGTPGVEVSEPHLSPPKHQGRPQ